MTGFELRWSSLALALVSTSALAHQPPDYDILQDQAPLPSASRHTAAPQSPLRPALAGVKSLTDPEANPAPDTRIAHWDTRSNLPTFIWANKSATPGTAPSVAAASAHFARMRPEEAASEQLTRHLSLYGQSSLAQAGASLSSVSQDMSGVSIVTYTQRFEGVEIFRQSLRLLLDANNALVAISGTLSPHVSTTGSSPRSATPRYQLSAAQAVARAYQDLTGAPLEPLLLQQKSRLTGDADPYAHYQMASYARPLAEPLVIPARAKPVYYPLPQGLVPAYYVEVNVASETQTRSDYYSYVVSAVDGQLLMRHNLSADAEFSYRVWAETSPPHTPLDGPTGGILTPHPTGVPDTVTPPPFVTPPLLTLQSAPFSRNDAWLASDATETRGNNVDAYADIVPPDGFTEGQDRRASLTSTRSFDRIMDFTISPEANLEQRQAAVTQLFYTVNWLHDWYYDVGFNEAAGNAQARNFSRGGLEGDVLFAEAQDHSFRNNASMSTPADGASPRMQMFLFDDAPRAVQYVDVTAPESVAGRYPAGFATYGPTSFDLAGAVVATVSGTPPNNFGCEELTNAAEVRGKIAFATRSSHCFNSGPVLFAQQAGAVGVILVNNEDSLEPIGIPFPAITIPVLLVKPADGERLRTALSTGLTARLYRLPAFSDGSIDNAIVAHEWGHYISNRLIFDANGLGNNQGGSMGEGWGDFTALLMMARAEDIQVPANAQWNGTYAVAQFALRGFTSADRTFYGIRRVTYSADVAKNALTFRHIDDTQDLPTSAPIRQSPESNSEVHNAGEIWATMLWECYVSLLRAHPFEDAQLRMKRYLVSSYKMTPHSPTFLEARDALIAAATASDPLDGDRFWAAFAKRGAGAGATAPDRWSKTHEGVVESYDLLDLVSASLDVPPGCDADSILDSGETAVLRIKLRNRGPSQTEGNTLQVTASSAAVTLGNGGQLRVPALARDQETNLIVNVALGSVATRQTLDFQIASRPESRPAPGSQKGFLRVNVHYDEKANASGTEDVESLRPPWTATHAADLAPVDWVIRQDPNTPLNHVFYGQVVNGTSDLSLITPPLAVSTTEPLSVAFKHAWSLGGVDSTSSDGAVIELSQDDGQTWTDVGAALYTGTISENGVSERKPNPLGSRPGLVGTSTDFPQLIAARLELGTAYAGKTVRLRFRIGSDGLSENTGWYLDDLQFSGITHMPFMTLQEEDSVCAGSFPPAVSAGPNLRFEERSTAMLHGTATDPNGRPLTSAWTQLSGPSVVLSGAATLMPTFPTPEVAAPTEMQFRLTVSNGRDTATSDVTVTVTNVNRAPTADAGGVGEVEEGADHTFTGSASDPDGDALSYQWVQQSGTPVALRDATSLNASFTAPEVTADETLTFALTASDAQTSTRATVDVTVRPVNPPEESRCGCASAGAGTSAGLLGLAMLALARRRRPLN